jgi:MFS family permease
MSDFPKTFEIPRRNALKTCYFFYFMPARLSDFFPALKHRNFRLFMPGQFISLLGFWMQNVGLSWLVYRLTHSSAHLGAVAFSQQIPILLLGLPAGGFVDRSNRHRLVIFTQTLALLQATALAWLTYLGNITVTQIMILGTVIGIISAFDMPARQSFLVEMVNREDLMNAIALNSSMFNAARMIGPAVAGFIVAEWGEALCFLLNGVSYVAVLISLLLMRITRTEVVRTQTFRKDLTEGFRYVRHTSAVRVMLLLLGCFGIAGFPFSVLLPVFADQIFQRGASGLGWLMTAVGLGALSGALFLVSRRGMTGITTRIVRGAFGFSVLLMLFSLATYFWLAFALLCMAGFCMMVMVASTNTAIQSSISDSFRGRVMSFFTTMLIGTAPIGSLIAGWVAKGIGPQTTVFLFATICLASSYWFHKHRPHIDSPENHGTPA